MHRLEGERRFYPWMTVIAKRISIDRARKHARIDLTDEPDLGSVEPDVDHLFAEVDADHVRRAMANVGPRHREVLQLREAEGLSYAAIASRLDVPVTTIEALLHRARKALRREFAAVTGEGRGLLGVPVLGWLATKVDGLRARAGDRWVEIGAVLAPVAVAAATAVAVLTPGVDSVPADRPVAAPALVEPAVPDEPTTGSLPVVQPEPTPAAPPVLHTETPTPPKRAADAPTIDAGPVDVFTGPEGTAAAKAAAGEMPVHGTAGPVTGGTDAPAIGEDVATFVADTVRFLVGGTP